MIPFIRTLLRALGRGILSLRYRVTTDGTDRLPALKRKTLLLPNHPGYIDPALVLTHCGDGLNPRPMVFSDTYRNPALHPLMRMIHALEIPKLDQHSRSAREQAQAMVDAVVAGLERGENFLIYPSGRLQRAGQEVIGAASAVAEILQRVPDANVVLIQTKGVWGSRFSFAQTGVLPDLNACLLRSLGDLLANLLFFLPRREIRIKARVQDRSQMPEPKRETLNPWLENWYNDGTSAEPEWVPYHCLWGQPEFDFPKTQAVDLAAAGEVPEKLRKEVDGILEDKLKRPLDEAEKAPETTLDKIGLDSLDRMEAAMEIERRFGFQSETVPDTLGGLYLLASGAGASGDAPAKAAPDEWRQRPLTDAPARVEGDTITEAFLAQALAKPKHIAMADDLSGAVTYEKALTGALLFAKRFRAFEGQNVGVLLPASAAADLVFLGLLFAGKTPVMLNWTTGQANLALARERMDIRHVLSARAFIDRLGLELPGAAFEFVEEHRKAISKFQALTQLLGIRFLGRGGVGSIYQCKKEDIAAVLFTSGSEKAPKAVPLTHANIIANVQAGAEALGLKTSDAVLGFLPPFHSFGLSGNMALALTTGMSVVHHPDPTDARGLARKMAAYRPTLLFSTPTFLSYILNASKPEDLTSLRLAVTGAEACPESVFAKCGEMAPAATITEGYGITECSPVVAVGRPGKITRGTIGQPLDNVETLLVNAESGEPVPPGQTGMLLVRGPSIFSGYLAHDGEQPFVECEGKRWYKTGDLVSQDEAGVLTFRGRLKRFIKAGGEMISLPALEAPLAAKYPPGEDGPRVAVEGIETESGRLIALFTTVELKLREANRLLTEHGFTGIMRLDEVRRVEKLPVLGTGKIDYKQLRAALEEKEEQAA